jgi:hypothetical protein
MYAYLAAMGGLRYWPGIQQASIVEVSLRPAIDGGEQEEDFVSASQYEYAPGRERTPAA